MLAQHRACDSQSPRNPTIRRHDGPHAGSAGAATFVRRAAPLEQRGTRSARHAATKMPGHRKPHLLDEMRTQPRTAPTLVATAGLH